MKNDILNEQVKLFNLMKSWDFSKSEIGDAGAKVLEKALRTNTKLDVLVLEDNNIGDAGAKYFIDALKTNTTMRKIDLKYNKISKSLIDQIEQKIKRNRGV